MEPRNLTQWDSLDIFRFEYDGNGNQIYIGQARPGASESDLVWKIRMLTYNASQQNTVIGFAGGTPAYVNSWTNRASYTYS